MEEGAETRGDYVFSFGAPAKETSQYPRVAQVLGRQCFLWDFLIKWESLQKMRNPRDHLLLEGAFMTIIPVRVQTKG